MPPNAQGHAYGRVISHPHMGLHRGQMMSASKAAARKAKPQHASKKNAHATKNSTKHTGRNMSGSMMKH